MMDVKLKNRREDVGVGGLMAEELNVVKAILFEILAKSGMPQKGTFVLRAQTLRQEMSGTCESRTVLSFNFPKGEKRRFLGMDRGSDQIANWVLNEAAGYSRQVEMGGTLRSGFNQPDWATIETTAGRFMVIFLADNGDDHTMKKVYLTITKTLGLLCPNDEVLQRVTNCTFNTVFDGIPWVAELEQTIKDMFFGHELSEVKAWKKWRDRNANHILLK